jgi:hypothetical protein
MRSNTITLQAAATTTGADSGVRPNSKDLTCQAYGTTSAGSGASTIKFQGSNVDVPSVDGDWVDLGTITLTLTTSKSGDGFTVAAAWRWVRSNITAISGTGAAVTTTIGVGS